MFDEKDFIEKFTGIPGFYSTIEQLKNNFKLILEHNIQSSSTSEMVMYKSENSKSKNSEYMIVEHFTDRSLDVIDYEYRDFENFGNQKNIFIRISDDVFDIRCSNSGNINHLFLVGNKLYVYNKESMITASKLLCGNANVSSVKEYESVSVFPDDIIVISPEIKDIGGKLSFAISCVVNSLFLENNKRRK